MRASLLSTHLRNSRRPRYLARRAFWAAAYARHPYGRPVSGTAESIGAITRADLQGFVADNFTRDNLFVGVVGDVTPAQLAALLDKAFGGLLEKRKSRPVPATAPKLEGGIVVRRFDTPQSVAIFGQPGLPRRHPDYYAAYILNHILGGGFTSRLYLEVREKRGLAYSVYSYLWPMRRSSLLLGGGATRKRAGRRFGCDRPLGMGPHGGKRAKRQRTGRRQEIPDRQLSAAVLPPQLLADRRHAGRIAVRGPGAGLFCQAERLYREGDPGGCPAGWRRAC